MEVDNMLARVGTCHASTPAVVDALNLEEASTPVVAARLATSVVDQNVVAPPP